MTKIEYANEVCRQLNNEGYETTIEENYRNNGALVAIIVKTGDTIQPVFSIGDEDIDPKTFTNYILSNLPSKRNVNLTKLSEIMEDKEEVLSRVNYILVNSKLNNKRSLPVRRRVNATLEVQYKIDICDICEDGLISLNHDHLERLKIDEEELFERAYNNTIQRYPYNLSDISDFIGMGPAANFVMYVLTNSTGVYGAGAILYRGINDILKDTIGEDYIIIPSSVHEVIVLPDVGETEEITMMIREVNRTVLSPDEVLSDRPYKLISDGCLIEA